jgi:hypothetical protein
MYHKKSVSIDFTHAFGRHTSKLGELVERNIFSCEIVLDEFPVDNFSEGIQIFPTHPQLAGAGNRL